MKKNILKNNVVQSLIASFSCIILGLFIGYVVLLFINPEGAWEAIITVIKNFFTYTKHEAQLKNFGNTLVKTAPLLMCALSVLFAYKVGLFRCGRSVCCRNLRRSLCRPCVALELAAVYDFCNCFGCRARRNRRRAQILL